MSHNLPSPLPLFDRNLLRTVEKVVPSAEREEWSRTWQAELWHMHHRSRNRRGNSRSQSLAITTDLSIGLTRDAFWLRTDSWRRIFSGTTTLCLVSLAGLCLLSAFIALVLNGSWHSLALYLAGPFKHSLFAAPLVVFVTFATASRGHTERSSPGRTLYRIKRQLFFTAKTSLVLLLAFLLSAEICQPIHAPLPNTAELLQIFFFVLFTLVGLRWAFRDQEQRCKQCLHSLATPARVGRPSHNLLEWNGTELLCKHGHGLLSVPEMETSWCQSSQWVDLNSTWDHAASI
jgi:hypothetical protein